MRMAGPVDRRCCCRTLAMFSDHTSRPSFYFLPARSVDTYSTSVLMKFSAFHRNLRMVNLHSSTSLSWLAKTTANLAQNRHYSSNARGRHPRGCPAGVGLTPRQVLVPWQVKSIINSSRYNAQRDKSISYCRQRARSVGRFGAVTLSTRRREPRSSLRLL